MAIVYHEGVSDYDFGGGHPFRGDRFPRFMRLLDSQGMLSHPLVTVVEPKPAGDPDLQLIHPEGYIREVEKREKSHIPLSGDTPLRPGIVDAARLIVGSSLKAGELVAEGAVKVAEGVGGGLHHAGRRYGGGFCVFNDVAVCAQAFLDRHGLERVLILDSDVHAGNGTMDIFYDEPRILFVSVHQDPRTIFPGTGFIDQIGAGSGEGYTVNVPLPPGADDECMSLFLEEVFKPLAEEFKPQAIIRNGGSDPHHQDGLGSLRLTYGGLHLIGKVVAEAAAEAGCGVVDLCCSGYNPATVAEGWFSLLSGVAGYEEFPTEQPPQSWMPNPLDETRSVIESVKRRLGDHWHFD
ncbi:MAG: histone deacetylase family protein [Candidatus Bathyarchaeota archaeon]|nr:MAG: histone deacetylase family protein [Candidatus Bathyarchaeota archaeon]